MYELALFAGAGGGILGGKLLGWETVGAVEIESYPRKILLQRQRDGILPWFPIWNDIQTFTIDNTECREYFEWLISIRDELVISGGFPCQPFSTASRGRKTAIDLWPEMSRVIGEINPRFVFAENVQKQPIEIAARDLQSMGYTTKAIPLSAKDLGADHLRKRYWLAGNSNKNRKSGFSINDETPWMSESSHGVWRDYRGLLRVDDGIPAKVDRLAACGNGQVPIVAATAWSILNNQ